MKLKEIVDQSGVGLQALRKRIQRESWRVNRTQAREVIEREGIQAKSERLRDTVLSECLKDAEIVQQTPPKNMSQSERRQRLISSIACNGEKAGAWSNGGNQTNVLNITTLSALRPIEQVVDAGQPVEFVEFDAEGKPVIYSREEYFLKYPEKRPVPVIDVTPQPAHVTNGAQLESEQVEGMRS